VRIIRFNDLTVTPWANGRGETRQVAVHHDRHRHPDFLWRISMATVAAHAPFSRLEGIDRTISVLRGEGLQLTVNGEHYHLTRESQPLHFKGEADTSGGSIAGETLDLNVMTRRDFYVHRVRKIDRADTSSVTIEHDQTFLVFTASAKVRANAATYNLDAWDTVLVERSDVRVEIHAAAPTHVFEITFSHAKSSP
jgi:uncharacterized protein